MENIDLLNIEGIDGKILQYVRINRGNEEYTSMLKEDYDKQQAEQSTPIVIDEAETI
jgi:hypothetical protein